MCLQRTSQPCPLQDLVRCWVAIWLLKESVQVRKVERRQARNQQGHVFQLKWKICCTPWQKRIVNYAIDREVGVWVFLQDLRCKETVDSDCLVARIASRNRSTLGTQMELTVTGSCQCVLNAFRGQAFCKLLT